MDQDGLKPLGGFMQTLVFDIELTLEDDGRWSATVPTLPGCATWGQTKEDAYNSLQEAIKAFIDILLDEGKLSLQELQQLATPLPENAITVTV